MYNYNLLYFQYKKLYLAYLKKIILILNEFHHKKYDQDYWEPIIGLFLRRFILNYLFLKRVSKKNFFFKSLKFSEVNFYKNYREFANIHDFEKSDKKYYCNFYCPKDSEFYQIKKIGFFTRLINNLKLIPVNLFLKIGITKVLFFESYFRKNLKRKFFLKSFFYFFTLPNLKLEKYKIEKIKIFNNRLRMIDTLSPKDKKDLLLNNILFFMPINYVENFNIISNEVKKINLCSAIYVDGNEINLDFIKFYIARLKLNKRKIITGQHSLRSGLEDYDTYFDYSKSISNHYLTWGWKEKSKIIKKFSSLRIFSSLDKYRNLSEINNSLLRICFILSGYNKVGECLHQNFFENKKAEYSRIELLKFLKKKNQFQISLKPRTGSFYLKDKNKFYKKFNIFKYKARMYEILRKFNVVIFEKLSLGVAECIYLNQPVIFYYPKNLYKQKNKEFNKMVKLLKKSNIYFENPKEVIKVIKSKENIDRWWFKKNNLINRKRFLKEYAKCFKFDDFESFKKLI